jgi:hypothetical protein
VTDAEFPGHGVGHVAVRLHGNHRIAGVERAVVQVRDELIERFRAHAAGKAVFEQEQGPLIGGGEGAVEVVDARQQFQRRMHAPSV